MSDTVLESLNQELDAAFREFAERPTQSGRVKLRGRLLTLAGALDVEVGMLEGEERRLLAGAISDVRKIAEAALTLPKEALITDKDTAPLPAPKLKVVKRQPQQNRGVQRGLMLVGALMFRDAMRAIFRKRS
jgi:hypothetical protein